MLVVPFFSRHRWDALNGTLVIGKRTRDKFLRLCEPDQREVW